MFVFSSKGYKLGHPLEEGVNIGPVISVQAADNIRAHIQDASKFEGYNNSSRSSAHPHPSLLSLSILLLVDKGASSLIPATHFPAVSSSNAYVAPTLLTNVNHSMTVMTEETFGPVLPIMRVTSDEEAIQLMNDSVYGLTASLWSEDVEVCLQLGDR